MCILILWAGDPKLNEGYRSGDVISVIEDNHVIGAKLIASPNYAFTYVPGVPAEDLFYLTQGEHVADPHPGDEDNRLEVRRREMRVDLIDKLPDKAQARNPHTAPSMSKGQVIASQQTKAPKGLPL